MNIRSINKEYSNFTEIPKSEIDSIYYLSNVPVSELNNGDIYKFKNITYLAVCSDKNVLDCGISNKVALLQKLVTIDFSKKQHHKTKPKYGDYDNTDVFCYEDKMLIIPDATDKKIKFNIPYNIKFLNIIDIGYYDFNFDNSFIENIHISVLDLYLDDFKLTNLPMTLKYLEISIIADSFLESVFYINLIKERCKIPFGCEVYINFLCFYDYTNIAHFAIE